MASHLAGPVGLAAAAEREAGSPLEESTKTQLWSAAAALADARAAISVCDAIAIAATR
jgi:hypothetical protein